MRSELVNIEAGKFKRINGVVLRTVISLMPTSFFSKNNITDAVAGRGITDGEVCDALDYLEGAGYIETRSVNERQPVRLTDFAFDMDLIEFKLSSRGKLVALGIVRDDGIEL